MKIFKKCRIFGSTAPLLSFQLQQSIKTLVVDLDVFSIPDELCFYHSSYKNRKKKNATGTNTENTDGENLGYSYEKADGGKIREILYEPHMRQSSLLLMEQTRVDMFFSTSAMSAAAAGATLTAA
jgi:hypothetical protein